MKRFFAILLAGLLLLSCTACSKPEEPKDTTSKPVLSTEHYTVTQGMLACFFTDYLNNFYNTYGNYLSYFGIDPEVSLKEQAYDEDETWFDFMMTEVVSTVDEMLLLAEDAYAHGIKPAESDTSHAKETIDNIKKATAENNLVFEDYIKDYYYDAITEEILLDTLVLSNFTYNYYEKVFSEISVSEEDLQAYLKGDGVQYVLADYAVYETSNRDLADKLKNATSHDAFRSLVEKDLLSIGFAEEEQEASDAYDYSCVALGATKENDSEELAWIFAEDRKAGDTTVFEYPDGELTNYAVIYLITPCFVNPAKTVDVRHILFFTSDEVADETVLAQATEVYDEWLKNPTEEYFAELANQHSQDGDSNTKGGLYQQVASGVRVAAFDEWLFTEGRQKGDSGMVQTEYGYHIMYYVGDNELVWKIAGDASIRSAKFEEFLNTLLTTYPITTNREVVALIEA